MATAAIIYPAVNSTTIYNRTPFFKGTGWYASGEEITGTWIYYKVDNSNWKSGSIWGGIQWPTTLSVGSHTLYIRSYSPNEGYSSTLSRTFTVANTSSISLTRGNLITDESSIDIIIPMLQNISKYYYNNTGSFTSQNTPNLISSSTVGQIRTFFTSLPYYHTEMMSASPFANFASGVG